MLTVINSLAAGADAGTTGSGSSSDPLVAFLDGLHGLSNLGAPVAGTSVSPSPPAGAVTMLSNGFNADAGVAQLIGALASLHDGNAAFNATPFAAPSDPGLHGVIAPAGQ